MGGVNRGGAIQIGAIIAGTRLELQGNQIHYNAQVNTAEVTQNAAF